MKLKSFGCSFIFGTDLSDDGSDRDYEGYSHNTWPALLAKKLGYEYACYARPGSGNLRILETILSQSTVDQNNLYVIGWSWIERFDYIGTATPYNPLGSSTIVPVHDTEKADFYYRNLHSQFRDKLTTLSYIKLAVDTLKQKNIPFIMTYMDELIFDNKWHTTSAVDNIQDYIRPYMNTFQGKNFVKWSKDQNFDISKSLHPLEAAHQAAADLVCQELDHWIIS